MHNGIALPPVVTWGNTGSSRLEDQLRCPDTSPSGELKPTSTENETKTNAKVLSNISQPAANPPQTKYPLRNVHKQQTQNGNR